MKRILLGALLVFVASLPSFATLYSTNWTTGFANGGVVPDNNLSGWTDTREVSTMPDGSSAACPSPWNSPAAGTATSTPTSFTTPASAYCWTAWAWE